MTAKEIVKQLQGLGGESYKKIMMKHGVPEPLYGVKIEELKKIAKQTKDGYELSLALYDTGIYDARYLAGLLTEPGKMKATDLQHWAEQANAPVLSEYTVAWVAAESQHGMAKAMEWIESPDERMASTGWATLSNIVTITADTDLDMTKLKSLLKKVEKTIHKSKNRVKAAMNVFVIATGIHVAPLNALAKETGERIGKVHVDVGDTACKIPDSLEYITKAEGKNAIGKKKKSARCL